MWLNVPKQMLVVTRPFVYISLSISAWSMPRLYLGIHQASVVKSSMSVHSFTSHTAIVSKIEAHKNCRINVKYPIKQNNLTN